MSREPKPDLTFAIGDVHGRADLLHRLQVNIAAAAARAGAQRPCVVYLGDYVDRGPASREVIDLAIDGLPNFQRVHLTGNHEAMMSLMFASGWNDDLVSWIQHGGVATLRSYGVDCQSADVFMDSPSAFRREFVAAVPSRHREFLDRLALKHEDAECIYVHAGLDPEAALDRQSADVLLWIREPFLSSDRDWGKLVVHGHTPSQFGPQRRPNRLNVDTAAFWSGCLTAAVLGGETPGYVVASQPRQALALIDVCGLATSEWLDWSLDCALDAGVNQVCIVLETAEARQDAAVRCANRGIACVSRTPEEFVATLKDHASGAAPAVRRGDLALTWPAEDSRLLFSAMLDAEQPKKSFR